MIWFMWGVICVLGTIVFLTAIRVGQLSKELVGFRLDIMERMIANASRRVTIGNSLVEITELSMKLASKVKSDRIETIEELITVNKHMAEIEEIVITLSRDYDVRQQTQL